MSLQANYYKELEGRDTIETEDGFIGYILLGKECFIAELYVIPESRQNGIGSEFVKQVSILAKEHGCTFISSTVNLLMNGVETSIKTHLSLGLKPVKAQDNKIWFAKEI